MLMYSRVRSKTGKATTAAAWHHNGETRPLTPSFRATGIARKDGHVYGAFYQVWDVYTNMDEKYGRYDGELMSTSGGGTLSQMKITGRGRDDHLKPLTQPYYVVVTADKQ